MTQLDYLVRTPLSEAIGYTLIHFLWEGIVIAAVLAAILPLIRSPRVRYVASTVALLAMLVSFGLTLIHFLPVRGSGTGAVLKIALPPWTPRPDVDGSGGRFPNFGTLVPWLAPAWIAGVLICYLRYAVGWMCSYRMRQRGVCNAPNRWQDAVTRLAIELKVSRPVALLESLLADAPVVLGHFRPVILVPLGFLSGLLPDQVEAILLHELAHIRRSDYFVNVCQRFIEALLFYHPAVWWISQVIRAERENCCDDMVVDLTGNAHGYAEALTTLEHSRLEQHWPARKVSVASTGGNLVKRIKRMLYPKGSSGGWAPTLAAIVLMATTAMAFAAWRIDPNGGVAPQQTDLKVSGAWQKWLSEDVVYIISDQERAAFEALTTNEGREHFVEQFWARRDPTPNTPENEFKEEHYRRIAYANRHWQGNLPGWKSDRGRIYIRYGPPDEIDSHPSGGSYNRPDSEGGGSAMTYPFEDWRYSRFEGVGNLTIEFVDSSSSGELRMTLDPKEKYKNP